MNKRTKKAKIGSCMLLVGKLDIHNKLYVKLHNFNKYNFIAELHIHAKAYLTLSKDRCATIEGVL